MGNTLDMNKIKEDHQARTKRIYEAFFKGRDAGDEEGVNYLTNIWEWAPGAIADALTELATIWREEAARLSDLPNPKPRGWKTTMESLRDCATRVSGIAVAMTKHGLPDSGNSASEDDAIPKALASMSSSTPNPAPLAGDGTASTGPAALNTAGEPTFVAVLDERGSFVTPEQFTAGIAAPHVLNADPHGLLVPPAFETSMVDHVALVQPRQDGKSELQQDMQAVHDRRMTVEQFRAKWPQKVSTEDMVAFLKGRHDSGPKGVAGASETTESTPSSAPGNSNGKGTPHLSDDPAGDFLRDLGKLTNTTGDWTKLDEIARQGLGADILIVDDPVNYRAAESALMDMDTFKEMIADNTLEEGTLVQAAASIIEQVTEKRAALAIDPGQVKVLKQAKVIDVSLPDEIYMRSGTPHDLSAPGDVPTIAVNWTIGVPDAPPAWTMQPPATVYNLDDDQSTWLPSPDHTSVSQANLAAECPMKWWLSKRRGASERPSWALVGGKALHSCIEWIETNPWSAEAPPVHTLWSRFFSEAIHQTQTENPDWPIETWHASNKGKEGPDFWNLDGPEMVHRFIAWSAQWRADGWELLKTADGRPVVELEFLTWIGGGPVKGFIDSAWYHPGKNAIVIIDWKSGSTKPADHFQQATYRHALEPLLGAWQVPPIWAGAFWDARTGQLGAPVDLDVRHPRAEVELRLSGPRRIDAAGLYMPNVNTGYGGCNSCSLKRSCPVGSRIGKGEISL